MKEITYLTSENYPEIFKLSEYAFQYRLTEDEYEKKCLEADRHKIYGFKMNHTLAGKLHVIPLEVFINGKLFSMGGISSVATWPEYSGQKIAEQLLKQSLIELQEKQTSLAYLHPFKAGFYRRFGFEFFCDSTEYIIPIEKLRHPWKKQGEVIRKDINLVDLNHVYEMFIKQFNGGLKRDKNWWKQRVLTDDHAEIILIKDELGNPQAYLIYKIENKRFEVIEMAYTHQTYAETIYHFIMKHEGTIKDVLMPTYQNNLLNYVLNDPIFTQKNHPYFMARIIDLESFLKEYEWEGSEAVNLFVTDNFLPHNTGLYKLSDKDIKKIKLEEVEDYVTMKIGDLTALLIGYKTIDDLKRLNKIQGEEKEINKLAKGIKVQATYLLDYF